MKEDMGTDENICLVAEELAGGPIEHLLKELLSQYDDRISKAWAHTGLIEGITLKLDLKPGSLPFRKHPYNTNNAMKKEIKMQVHELLTHT